ncbi:MAG TPA: YfhO family protein, partial [Gemmatimonadales bacterium]|nr:YfhO family protein [Gemmatimonadales bacterium]
MTTTAASAAPTAVSYAPRRPHLTALGVVSIFIIILSLPMMKGRWLASPNGDQYSSGYAVKEWARNAERQTGHFPLWNPMIMGGLPYIDVVTHGDAVYPPTAALREVMPAYEAMNIGFFLHYILLGFLMYLFLRRLGASWIGAVTGGIAYQLSGLIISYVHPGHDGKLFVSTMLPLAFLALLAALRDRRTWGYPLLAVAVALCLLSPHVQTTYYLLIASALFAIYLTFGEPSSEAVGKRVTRLALTLAAVIVGFGIAAVQILPFIQYIPHSPRAAGYAVDYQGTTSFGIPWNHIPEFIIAGFTGDTETYWGSNPLKLHSEYLGLPVVALALLGLGDRRRRLVWWLGGIGTLFLLIALGGSTPFYHLWWAMMPMVKKTRAPGMVFFVVAFCTATFAAFGVDRLERREPSASKHARIWLIAAGVIALLGLIGFFGQLAQMMAPGERLAAAIARGSFIRLSTLIGSVALAAVGLLAWGWIKGRVPVALLAFGLPLLVGADLWRNGQHFWQYSPKPSEGLYRSDAIVARLQAEPKPWRVFNSGDRYGVYPHNTLMAFG